MVRVVSTIVNGGIEWLDSIERQVIKATLKVANHTALLGEKRVKSIMEKEAYDTGRLLRSVNSSVSLLRDYVHLSIGTNLEYAFYVEYGRKPGKFPNVDAIVRWVGRKMREKGINARVNVTFDQLKAMAAQKTQRNNPSSQAKIARQQLTAAYLVGRKIAKKGITQKLIFKRLEDGLLSYFSSLLANELQLIR